MSLPTAVPPSPSPRDRAVGLLLGAIGVALFALTLPMTRIAVSDLAPAWVGLGRVALAGSTAALVLVLQRAPWPRGEVWRLAAVAFGAGFGFPLLTSVAMHTSGAAPGAVILGLLPLATALFAAWLGGERPRARFWICAVAGSAVVAGFA